MIRTLSMLMALSVTVPAFANLEPNADLQSRDEIIHALAARHENLKAPHCPMLILEDAKVKAWIATGGRVERVQVYSEREVPNSIGTKSKVVDVTAETCSKRYAQGVSACVQWSRLTTITCELK